MAKLDKRLGLEISSPPLVRSSSPNRAKRIDRLLGRDWRIAFPFVLPVVLIMIGLIAWPFINALLLSMTTRSLINGTTQYVGLANYARLLTDTDFIISVKNTMV